MDIIKIVSAIFVIIGIVFVLIGVYTVISPASQAVNQTISSLPNYFTGVFSSTVSGGILIVPGIIFIIIGRFITPRSASY